MSDFCLLFCCYCFGSLRTKFSLKRWKCCFLNGHIHAPTALSPEHILCSFAGWVIAMGQCRTTVRGGGEGVVWDCTSPGIRSIALHVGEDKDPTPKLQVKRTEVERGNVELLTRGEVSKATNSILNSATISLYLSLKSMFIYCYFFIYAITKWNKGLIRLLLSWTSVHWPL